MLTGGCADESERRQERSEIRLFLVGEIEAERRLVVVDDGGNVGSDAVVEIRRARGKTADVRRLELVEIGKHAVADPAPRIGALDDLARRAVLERVDGLAGPKLGSRDADVEQRAVHVLAVVRRVVTTATGASAGDVLIVEDFLAT